MYLASEIKVCVFAQEQANVTNKSRFAWESHINCIQIFIVYRMISPKGQDVQNLSSDYTLLQKFNCIWVGIFSPSC